MKLALKEVLLGTALAILVFLAVRGFDITPLILIAAMVLVLKFTVDNRTE